MIVLLMVMLMVMHIRATVAGLMRMDGRKEATDGGQ